ncbi:MAG: dihydroorotase family protein [Thermoproteota archaeon]
MSELAISGRVWIGREFHEAAVILKEGRILEILPKSSVPLNVPLIDFGNNLILPGLVDVHVHLRDFEQSYKEDFSSGTKAAIAGGYTTVLTMPNTKPPISSLEMLQSAKERTKDKIFCDVGFHIGLNENPINSIKALMEGGFSIKLYPEDIMLISKDREKKEILTKEEKIFFTAHCEDLERIEANKAKIENKVENHSMIRDEIAELNGVELCLKLLKLKNLHIVHVSSSLALKRLIGESELDKKLTFEVTVHHLALTKKRVEELKGIAKTNPPLRSEEDALALRKALNEGKVTAIVTDHAPHSIEEKKLEEYDSIPSGFPGLETAIPALLTLVKLGAISLEETILALTSKPAKRFQIHNVGEIKRNSFANLTVVKQNEKWKIKSSNFLSKAKFSPFENMEVVGKVIAVFLRGEKVFEEGSILSNPKGRVIIKNWNL